MKLKYKKPIIFICLCLSSLFATLGCGLLNRSGGGNSVLPVKSLTLTIDRSQREDLFEQLRKFTEKHGFESRLTDFNTNGENFQFSMTRNDVTIIVGDIPPDQTLVKIRLYAKYPGYTVDESTIDELFTDLKVFLSEIPNVRIVEEN